MQRVNLVENVFAFYTKICALLCAEKRKEKAQNEKFRPDEKESPPIKCNIKWCFYLHFQFAFFPTLVSTFGNCPHFGSSFWVTKKRRFVKIENEESYTLSHMHFHWIRMNLELINAIVIAVVVQSK